ncbi:MAG: pilus assembly protein [Gammaproteobacteria bacterium]|nr:pilus assembly protein [Gammaproteobacteria bacterium]
MMRRRQSGTTSVEFAIVGALFFIVLFAIVEFGRLLFVWNALAEGTRRGARVAVICPVNHSAIKRVAIFSNPGGPSTSLVIPGLSEANVQLQYINENGATLADPVSSFRQIRFVKVRLVNFTYQMLIPYFDLNLSSPSFEATLPRESLGVPRVGAGAQCFGSAA